MSGVSSAREASPTATVSVPREPLELDWGGLAIREVFPSEIPDVFFGRPVTIVGRFDGALPKDRVAVRIRGRAGGEWRDTGASSGDGRGPRGALPKVWARAKIADLTSRARKGTELESLRAGITAVALEYGLLSAYTAFIAVDPLTRAPGESTTAPVAVPVPEGVDFHSTVQGG